MFVSLTGVAVIVSGGEPARLAGLVAQYRRPRRWSSRSAVYALYSTLLRKRPAIAPISFLTATMGIGAATASVPLTSLEYAVGRALRAARRRVDFAAIAYVAIFPSILSYLCFNRGVELIGANRAGPFFHLIPLFGVVLAVVFLGERPALYHLVGAALIIGGVALAGAAAEAARA